MVRKEGGQNPTESPKFRPNIYLDVASELVTDRAEFLRNSLKNIRNENPDLHDQFIKLSVAIPQRDAAVDWAVSYYELKSRLARKPDGITSIPRVTNDTITSFLTHDSRAMAPLLRRLDQVDKNSREASLIKKQLSEVVEKQEDERSKKIEDDIKKDPNLASFWSMYSLAYMKYMTSGYGEQDIQSIFQPLHLILDSLAMQESADDFRKNFPQT